MLFVDAQRREGASRYESWSKSYSKVNPKLIGKVGRKLSKVRRKSWIKVNFLKLLPKLEKLLSKVEH